MTGARVFLCMVGMTSLMLNCSRPSKSAPRPSASTRATLAAGVTAGTLATATSAAAPASSVTPSRVALVYADVTSSLRFEEVESVARLTSSLVLALKPGTAFTIYPIQSDAMHAAIFTGQVKERPTNPRNLGPYLRERKTVPERIRAEIERQYCIVNYPSDRRPADCPAAILPWRAQVDNRSCILEAVREAAKRLDEYHDTTIGTPEVFFVSDMIEECDVTIPGGRIKLNKRDIRSEIAAVPQYQGLPDLHGARVTVVLPYDDRVTPEAKRWRPQGSQLEDYWKAVFTRANADMRADHFYFNTGLPKRLMKAR